MPVPTRRRTRNKSDDLLIPTQADVSAGPSAKKAKTTKKLKERTESDPDKENVLKDKNILVETVTRAGLILKTGKEANILTKDQAVFLKAAHKDITTHIQYPQNVQVNYLFRIVKMLSISMNVTLGTKQLYLLKIYLRMTGGDNI